MEAVVGAEGSRVVVISEGMGFHPFSLHSSQLQKQSRSPRKFPSRQFRVKSCLKLSIANSLNLFHFEKILSYNNSSVAAHRMLCHLLGRCRYSHLHSFLLCNYSI